MAKKSNRVNVNIAYTKELINRISVNAEFNFVLALNALLDKHRVLSRHKDTISPVVTGSVTDTVTGFATYGCNLNVNFDIKHSPTELYPYTRLHYVLFEIATLVEQYRPHFERMEATLDLDGMPQPWALVAGPQSMLLRKGADQWNATQYLIPGFHNTHHLVDGLCVMGEPRAVADFKKVWTYYADKWYEAFEPGELTDLEERGVHHGPNLDIISMMRNHTGIQWQHLLVWVHAANIPGNDGWYVINLDSSDEWLVAGVKYTYTYSESLISEKMPFTCKALRKQTVFLPDMEHVSFSTESE